jgi:hypothetical protein
MRNLKREPSEVVPRNPFCRLHFEAGMEIVHDCEANEVFVQAVDYHAGRLVFTPELLLRIAQHVGKGHAAERRLRRAFRSPRKTPRGRGNARRHSLRRKAARPRAANAAFVEQHVRHTFYRNAGEKSRKGRRVNVPFVL